MGREREGQMGTRTGKLLVIDIRHSLLDGPKNLITIPDTFDVLVTRDLKKFHIVDFNPYIPNTDPLLFTYDELFTLLEDISLGEPPRTLPVFRVIDSPAHPAAGGNAPIHQHNMVPFEALSLSNGKDIEEFAEAWKDEIQNSMRE